ncbi:MAG: UDP-N-acetylmuramate dehydrogenase [Ignavibacteriaceae bacterium]|jgi:UDP-N-acetylmuramate dehydrogenase|nr:UDP-N-acetylmuramate dehydrogenase [Ignavibacteriaceae bacterium]
MKIQENYSLKELNTFKIDVKAKNFIEIEDEIELKEVVKEYNSKGEKILILGGGTNILFTNDFDGLVIHLNTKGIDIVSKNDKEIIMDFQAGESWDDVVLYAVKNGYYGIENLSLIPGTIGAAPIQNIGAYGAELKDVFYSLDGFFIDNLKEKSFSLAECEFGYRDSIFKRELKDKFIITSIKLKLSKEKNFKLNYRDLADLNKLRKNITLEKVRNHVVKVRESKLPNPKVLGNAGSFFKNPEITKQKLSDLMDQNPALPYFKSPDGKIKLPAGWLIEQCGWKGKRDGDVASYHRQALIIINYGNATSQSILKFTQEIKDSVISKFGIELEQEVNFY